MDFFMPASRDSVRLLLFSGVTLAACREDLRSMRVSRLPLLALLCALLISPECGQGTSLPLELLAGCTAGIISFESARIFSGKKIGLADVWMAGGIGALGGIEFLVIATLAAVMLMLPARKGIPVPFLPALFAGTLFSRIVLPFFGHP